jgi:hypothetical protein
MTQRSIHRPTRTTATTAVRAHAMTGARRIDHVIVNVALAALVLVVVVLITSPTGAG